jgi:hypothetical protein
MSAQRRSWNMRSVYWLADQPHGPVSSHQGLGSVTAKNRLGGGVDGPPVGQIILDGNAGDDRAVRRPSRLHTAPPHPLGCADDR